MKFIRFQFFLALAALSSVFGQQKAVLFNDTSAWYHWGCTGTSIALKERIESLGFELTAFPINANAASMDGWLDTINNATLLVSGRFHHSIAAFCLNTRFISLNSNTHKVHAICAMMGETEPLLYSDPNLLEKLNLRTAAILSSSAPDNSEKMKFLCELAEKNFDGLRVFAEKNSSKSLISN